MLQKTNTFLKFTDSSFLWKVILFLSFLIFKNRFTHVSSLNFWLTHRFIDLSHSLRPVSRARISLRLHNNWTSTSTFKTMRSHRSLLFILFKSRRASYIFNWSFGTLYNNFLNWIKYVLILFFLKKFKAVLFTILCLALSFLPISIWFVFFLVN